MIPRLLQNRNGPLWIWAAPEPKVQYTMGVDTSAGVRGSDPCVAEVFTLETREQVAEWYGWQQPYEFGQTVALLAQFFNDAHVGIETHPSPHGISCYESAERAGAKNLFVQRKWDSRANLYQTTKGWHTSEQGKGVLLSAVAEALADQVAFRSARLLNEILNAQLDDRDRVDRKCRNDCIIAAGIALKVGSLMRVEKRTKVQEKPEPAPGTREAFWDDYRARRGGSDVKWDTLTGQGY